MSVQRVIERVAVAGEIDRAAIEREPRVADTVAVRQQREARHAERIARGKRGVGSRAQPVDFAVVVRIEERRDCAADVRCDQRAPRAVA
ncbi:hypothetical protein AWB81_01484 [Caballeronia arationis]|nr:hypothetical protein AWB81_01484 [Caballeronia arationis]